MQHAKISWKSCLKIQRDCFVLISYLKYFSVASIVYPKVEIYIMIFLRKMNTMIDIGKWIIKAAEAAIHIYTLQELLIYK